MVDWQSPAQLARDALAFSNLIHLLFGIYLWEFCVSLEFDLSFITGKREFRWPLTFYFIDRYCLLACFIGLLIALNAQSELNCEALYIFIQCTANVANGMASINLSLRTMAVWGMKWYIVGPLVSIILGHWSLLLHGILVTAKWIPGEGCVISSTDSKLLSAITIYAMSFDFIVLLLTAFKLARPSGGLVRTQSRLVNMMFADGLYYFIAAFLAHLTATVFMTLDLNAVMSIIGNGPAVIVATIAASRVVRRLTNFSTNVETFSSRATGHGSSAQQIYRQTFTKPQTSVHVQMETLTLSEPTRCDAERGVVKVGLNSEEQQNNNDFKNEPYAN